jgi:hypothetical protein
VTHFTVNGTERKRVPPPARRALAEISAIPRTSPPDVALARLVNILQLDN